MRWLLVKDLQILRRSPLLVGLLIIYPILIALLIGFALSRGPGKPHVAIFNQVPPGQGTFQIGSQQVNASSFAPRLFDYVTPIKVHSRAEAVADVRSGKALAALIIPPDIARKLSTGLEQPQVEVIYNGSDPVKAQFVHSTLRARLADVNAALSAKFIDVASGYLHVLLAGGSFEVGSQHISFLGLQRTREILRKVRDGLPQSSPDRQPLSQVIGFASLAIDNLALSKSALRTVGSPIKVKQTTIDGARTPLDAFAVAIAVAVSLMFVTVLLASGLLALEREENAFPRLVRGLVSRLGLLVEKVGLSAGCAALVTLLLLIGLAAFLSLDWSRLPLWVLALVFGGLAFGALGVAIGALAREVRAASLLAFLLSLPIAFLALVPSGAVAGALYTVIRVVSAIFPFKPTLQALNAAINGGPGGIGVPILHLALLAAAFTLLARLALRRFD